VGIAFISSSTRIGDWPKMAQQFRLRFLGLHAQLAPLHAVLRAGPVAPHLRPTGPSSAKFTSSAGVTARTATLGPPPVKYEVPHRYAEDQEPRLAVLSAKAMLLAYFGAPEGNPMPRTKQSR